jgi:hypothetical protein
LSTNQNKPGQARARQSSIRDFALQGCVNFHLFARAEEKSLHIFEQKVLMFGVDGAQAVMIDQLILRGQPGFPASQADFGVNLAAQRIAEGRFFQAGELLFATRASDDLSHFVCSLFTKGG